MTKLILKYSHKDKPFQNLGRILFSEVHVLTGTMPKGDTLADLGEDDELILYSTAFPLAYRRGNLRCKVSLMVREPRAVQKFFYWLLKFFAFRFHRVLTHDDYLMDRVPNAERWIHGGTLIDPGAVGSPQKTKRISIFASKKKFAEGHKLRHQIISWAKTNEVELDAFGRGFYPVESKIEGHRDYCFSVVIENCSTPGYFSEQILDCMLCETVPLYWGDERITEYFDGDGMIHCRNFEELTDAIKRVRIEDYSAYKDVITTNKQRALESLEIKKCMWRISH